MSKSTKIIIAVVVVLALVALVFFVLKNKTQAPTEQKIFSEAEARVIAEATCIKGGESLTPGYYNEGTKTWWFDANLNATQPGCNPACVVSEETKTAEINWRCTGLITPTSAEEIKKLFVAKYPKYASTLNVRIDQETENHARGGIGFAAGGTGGIFLATKVGGEWQIVFDGNGEIACDLSRYGFPENMLADCAK